MYTDELLGMEVIKSNGSDSALFTTLYVAVNYLIENPIIEDKPLEHSKPSQIEDLVPLQLDEKYLDAESEIAWKFFSPSLVYKPNFDLMQKLKLWNYWSMETIVYLSIDIVH